MKMTLQLCYIKKASHVILPLLLNANTKVKNLCIWYFDEYSQQSYNSVKIFKFSCSFLDYNWVFFGPYKIRIDRNHYTPTTNHIISWGFLQSIVIADGYNQQKFYCDCE